MQKYLLRLLAFLARHILAIHRPYIIGVTGTVGKTTITSHVTMLLGSYFPQGTVGASAYHYNGEYGLPLTIIGAKTGGKNPFLWLWVVCIAFYRMLRPYPRYLVLEYGIDHPGEMDFLLSIAVPDVIIIAPIAPNHLEQFSTLDRYREEKLKTVKHEKTIVIAHDSHRPFLDSANVRFYGEDAYSEARLVSSTQRIDSLLANIEYKGETYEAVLSVFGSYQAENILPLFPLADICAIPLESVSSIFPKLAPEPGRSSIIGGISGATIIDGSYNGGYESIIEGLRSLLPFLATHRILLFLGDMRELGDHAKEIHRAVATFILEHFSSKEYDVGVFLVGPLCQEYIYPLLEKYIPTSHSLSSRELGRTIRNTIMTEVKPTIVYVKGSQNTIFLEEGIKEFLADPLEWKNLTRQSSTWKKKKESFFVTIEKKLK